MSNQCSLCKLCCEFSEHGKYTPIKNRQSTFSGQSTCAAANLLLATNPLAYLTVVAYVQGSISLCRLAQLLETETKNICQSELRSLGADLIYRHVLQLYRPSIAWLASSSLKSTRWTRQWLAQALIVAHHDPKHKQLESTHKHRAL